MSTAQRSWWNVSTPKNEPPRRPPDDLLWLIAVASIVAPVAGLIAALIGFFKLVEKQPGGGWWLAAGALLLLADYLTDIWLHRVSRDVCDEPQLNARGAKHIGRVVVLEAPIEAGRGRVRMPDSFWSIEGPDLPAGARVRIIAARGAVLIVEQA